MELGNRAQNYHHEGTFIVWLFLLFKALKIFSKLKFSLDERERDLESNSKAHLLQMHWMHGSKLYLQLDAFPYKSQQDYERITTSISASWLKNPLLCLKLQPQTAQEI